MPPHLLQDLNSRSKIKNENAAHIGQEVLGEKYSQMHE